MAFLPFLSTVATNFDRHGAFLAPSSFPTIASTELALRGGGGATLPTLLNTSTPLAVFSCTTVFAMMLFCAIVLMPGLARLSDATFLKAFQAIDAIIQDGQPAFITLWLGSVMSLVTSAVLVFLSPDESKKTKILWALFSILYLAGQVSTIRINLPLNDAVQKLAIDKLDASALSAERLNFEVPWVRANWFRTIAFGLTSAFLILRRHGL